MSDKIFGRNPVLEALKSEREIKKIITLKSGEGSIRKIIAIARDKNIPITFVDKKVLDREAEGQNHQGIIAFTESFQYAELDDIFENAKQKNEDPFIVILDSIEDPHNLGAIIRSADGAGVHGVIVPKNRAAGVNATVAKISVGAVEYVPIVQVTNLSQAMDKLAERGVWIYALDMGGDAYYSADISGAVAIVVGNEGKGVSRLVKEKSDFCISIPMKGHVDSLNASNAAAVVLYEIRRQRDGGGYVGKK